MHYIIVERCGACKGVVNIPEEELDRGNFVCQCDWWGDMATLDNDADDGKQKLI